MIRPMLASFALLLGARSLAAQAAPTLTRADWERDKKNVLAYRLPTSRDTTKAAYHGNGKMITATVPPMMSASSGIIRSNRHGRRAKASAGRLAPMRALRRRSLSNGRLAKAGI